MIKNLLVWITLIGVVLFFCIEPTHAGVSNCEAAEPSSEARKVATESTRAPCPIVAKKHGFWINALASEHIQEQSSNASWITLSQARSLLESGTNEAILFVGTGFDDTELAKQCAQLLPSCDPAQCVVLQGGIAMLSRTPELSAFEAMTLLLGQGTTVKLESAVPLSSALTEFLRLADRTHTLIDKRNDRAESSQALWLTSAVDSTNRRLAHYAIRGGQVELTRVVELHQALRGATYQTPKLPCYLAQ